MLLHFPLVPYRVPPRGGRKSKVATAWLGSPGVQRAAGRLSRMASAGSLALAGSLFLRFSAGFRLDSRSATRILLGFYQDCIRIS